MLPINGQQRVPEIVTPLVFYRYVPKLGHVAVSKHARARMELESISQAMFEDVLLCPAQDDIPDGHSVVLREKNGIRIVVERNPVPSKGAALVVTVYRPKDRECISRLFYRR